ncbi:MAG: hypothetical protein KJ601_03690 [Nanoarchaeota archaeon]|nr:hypothetical protein [Nanoarchaeota archaeon]MBU1704775.1 hypothetical protein [Nanoarchaeota archaeon]
MDKFQENVDAWIKQINSEFSDLKTGFMIVRENQTNIDHNYELINGLKAEIEELKNEIKALTLLQIAHLKQKV